MDMEREKEERERVRERKGLEREGDEVGGRTVGRWDLPFEAKRKGTFQRR